MYLLQKWRPSPKKHSLKYRACAAHSCGNHLRSLRYSTRHNPICGVTQETGLQRTGWKSQPVDKKRNLYFSFEGITSKLSCRVKIKKKKNRKENQHLWKSMCENFLILLLCRAFILQLVVLGGALIPDKSNIITVLPSFPSFQQERQHCSGTALWIFSFIEYISRAYGTFAQIITLACVAWRTQYRMRGLL